MDHPPTCRRRLTKKAADRARHVTGCRRRLTTNLRLISELSNVAMMQTMHHRKNRVRDGEMEHWSAEMI
jgi:hypothetical protein